MPEGSNEKERAKATKNNIEPPAKRSKKDPTLTKVPSTPKPQPTTTAPDSRTEAGGLGTSPTRKGKENSRNLGTSVLRAWGVLLTRTRKRYSIAHYALRRETI